MPTKGQQSGMRGVYLVAASRRMRTPMSAEAPHGMASGGEKLKNIEIDGPYLEAQSDSLCSGVSQW